MTLAQRLLVGVTCVALLIAARKHRSDGAARHVAASADMARSTAARSAGTSFTGPFECTAPHVDDRIAGLNDQYFDNALAWLCIQSDVDLQIVFTGSVPHGELEEFARDYMRKRDIGRYLHGRGLVIVYEQSSNRMRFEVGPGLEEVFPDGYLGFLLRETATQRFEEHSPNTAMACLLIMLCYRLAEEQLGVAYDPSAVLRITRREQLAAGAGTSAGLTGAHRSRHVATAEERRIFAPQPTVADAQAMYLRWLREGAVVTGAPLFYTGSEGVMRMVQSSGGAAFMDLMEDGQTYTIVTRGDLGMLIYTSTPLESPSFFRRGPQGWQKDVQAEVSDTQEIAEAGYTWRMRPTPDDYSRTFQDLFEYHHNVLRVKGGNNRRFFGRIVAADTASSAR